MVLIMLAIPIVFVVVQNRQMQTKSRSSVHGAPSINTVTLPDGKLGEMYTGEIFASFLGPHQDIDLTVTNLPEGLAIGNCTQKYDNPIIPRPNTIRACHITGTPRTAGTFQLAVTAKIPDGLVDEMRTLPLTVKGR